MSSRLSTGLGKALSGVGPPAEPPASWRVALSVVLTLIGLGISIYLTIVHYVGNQLLACPAGAHGGAIDCAAVITSPQSIVFGIPVAVLGLAFYAVLAVVNSPWAWRAADRRIHLARLVLCVVGIGFVLYLVSAELLVIKAICIWCTGVHIVTFAQLLLVVSTVPAMLGWGRETPVPAPRKGTGARQEGGAQANRSKPVAATRRAGPRSTTGPRR